MSWKFNCFSFLLSGLLFLCSATCAGELEDAANAYEQGNFSEVIKIVRPFAEKNAAWAESIFGMLFENGQGVEQDDAQAFRWYKSASTHGNAYAQFKLGQMLEVGLGTIQDHEASMKWYFKAAEQGLISAQYRLGYLYDIGKGTTQNYELAAKWYRLAAINGHPIAQVN